VPLPVSPSWVAGHYEFVFLIGENNVEEIPALLEKLKGTLHEASHTLSAAWSLLSFEG